MASVLPTNSSKKENCKNIIMEATSIDRFCALDYSQPASQLGGSPGARFLMPGARQPVQAAPTRQGLPGFHPNRVQATSRLGSNTDKFGQGAIQTAPIYTVPCPATPTRACSAI